MCVLHVYKNWWYTSCHVPTYVCVFVSMQVQYVLMSVYWVCVCVCLYACTLVMGCNVVVSLQNDVNEDDGVSAETAEVLSLACHLWEGERTLRHNPP